MGVFSRTRDPSQTPAAKGGAEGVARHGVEQGGQDAAALPRELPLTVGDFHRQAGSQGVILEILHQATGQAQLIIRCPPLIGPDEFHREGRRRGWHQGSPQQQGPEKDRHRHSEPGFNHFPHSLSFPFKQVIGAINQGPAPRARRAT